MKHLGRYRIVGTLGKGGMGSVYLAEDPFRSERVAIKVPSRQAAEARYGAHSYEALFYNETRAVGGLRHPHIVELLDAGESDGDYYIVMAYVEESETLERFSNGERLLSAARIADLGFQCAEALDYAHRKGVVHRDIKPSNILLERDGSPLIVDFGIAQLAGSPADDTAPLVPAGSPLYMSPEQAEGEFVTGSTDVYSLGVVLYELLTGVNPFTAKTVPAIARRVLTHRPPNPRELRTDMPTELAAVIMRCLEKSSLDRFASAREMAQALAPICGGGREPLDTVQAEGRVDQLRMLPFFASFKESDIWELLRWSQWREFKMGAVILEEAVHGDELFVLAAGRVKVVKGGEAVAFIETGECFGEMAFLARQERSASVVALDSVLAIAITASQLACASPSCQVVFQRVLIETLVGRLSETTDALAHAQH